MGQGTKENKTMHSKFIVISVAHNCVTHNSMVE